MNNPRKLVYKDGTPMREHTSKIIEELINKQQTSVDSLPVTGNLNIDTSGCYYPVVIKDENFQKLLAIQTKPEVKYWFKDKEVTLNELIEILKKA